MNGYENIPAHWEIARIKQKCRLIGSGTTPNTNQSSYYGGVINWIQSGDLYQKDFISFTERTVTESALQDYSALHIYKPPFIVVAMYGASIGNVAVSNITACVNQACCVLIPNKDVSMSYMFYWLKYYKEFFIAQSAGGSQTNISQRKIRNGVFLVPPIEEQRQIASFLDWKISGIDRLIAIRKDELTNLEDLKKAVITRAVTRGNWEHVKIKRLFKIFSGATPDSENPNFWDGNIIWITPADFQTKDKYIYHGAKYITESGFKACSTSLVPSGSIIFTKRAPVGKVAISKSELCTNQGCLSCVPLEGVVPEYFYYVMSVCTDEFESLSAGATFKEISLSKFRNVLLPCPPISEQKRIAGYLDKICSEIDSAITNFTEQIDTLKELKARLISDTVTGKIDVRNIPVPEQEKIS